MLMFPPLGGTEDGRRWDPTAPITARTSAIRCSSVRSSCGGTGSDIPVPRLSNRIRRANHAMRSKPAGQIRQLPAELDV
jgi:hypothetical protein